MVTNQSESHISVLRLESDRNHILTSGRNRKQIFGCSISAKSKSQFRYVLLKKKEGKKLTESHFFRNHDKFIYSLKNKILLKYLTI